SVCMSDGSSLALCGGVADDGGSLSRWSAKKNNSKRSTILQHLLATPHQQMLQNSSALEIKGSGAIDRPKHGRRNNEAEPGKRSCISTASIRLPVLYTNERENTASTGKMCGVLNLVKTSPSATPQDISLFNLLVAYSGLLSSHTVGG
ncbi:unnamed protein product, partial [Pleuronectes platessa]